MGTLRHLDPKVICICADAPFDCGLRRGAALSSSSSGRVAISAEKLNRCLHLGQGFRINHLLCSYFDPYHVVLTALGLHRASGSCPQGLFLCLEACDDQTSFSGKVFFIVNIAQYRAFGTV